MRLISSSMFAMVVLAACGGDGDKVVNYKLKMTNAPACPSDGNQPTGNSLKRVLVVRAETSSEAHTGFTFAGIRYRDDAISETNAQVMLAKSGKQSVKFRFGACPSMEKPSGNQVVFGCDDSKVEWYAEQQVTLDPKDLVVFGEPGESQATVQWPWPSNELECWTGKAAPHPTPL